MVDLSDCMCLKVDDIYFVLRHIDDNDFFVVHLAKTVNTLVLFFIEYITLLVDMYDTFLAAVVPNGHNECVVVCCCDSENSRDWFLKLDCCGFITKLQHASLKYLLYLVMLI